MFLVVIAPSPGTSIARVKVNDLFKQADLVAIVRILSGDSEHYPVTVYKAEVVTAFKGVTQGEKIYFGPFVSYGTGNEYLVFLSKSEKGVEPQGEASGFNYGSVHSFFQIMYAGFGIMEIEYSCVFDGKDVKQQCDYAVKLNPEQIILPDSIRVFPQGDADAVTNYHKWVRRDGLVELLEQMKRAR